MTHQTGDEPVVATLPPVCVRSSPWIEASVVEGREERGSSPLPRSGGGASIRPTRPERSGGGIADPRRALRARFGLPGRPLCDRASARPRLPHLTVGETKTWAVPFLPSLCSGFLLHFRGGGEAVVGRSAQRLVVTVTWVVMSRSSSSFRKGSGSKASSGGCTPGATLPAACQAAARAGSTPVGRAPFCVRTPIL